jgi:integrase/recombinase XerC
MIPMNPDLIRAYKEWRDVRGDIDGEQLFVTRNGTSFPDKGLISS